MLNIWQPLRHSAATLSATALLILGVLGESQAIGRPPELPGRLPYQVAARQAHRGSDHWPNFGALLDAQRNSAQRNSAQAQSNKPHPAVARIIVPEGSVTAYGSGTLVDVREQFGLVITNWHVVRDASGPIEVVFSGGFRSQARALKVDPDWDLAALVIWEPPVEPVKLATTPPRPGDRLTIHGFGKGKYRVATGKCTQFYAPRPNFPQEMVELDVEARQGDSGGPIFNDRGELTGVLFGAGQGTTIGSFGRRVESFLATLAPGIGHGDSETMLAAAPKIQPSVPADRQQDRTNFFANHSCPQYGCSQDCCPLGCPGGSCRPPANSVQTPTRNSSPATDRIAARADISPWQSVAAEKPPATISANGSTTAVPTTAFAASNAAVSNANVAKPQAGGIADQAKSFLAIVGLLTVCIQIVRVVT